MRTYENLEQVRKERGDTFVVVGGKVLDIETFARAHPGGEGVLREYAGRECDDAFFEVHRSEVLEKWAKKLQVGVLAGRQTCVEAWDTVSRIPYGESGHASGLQRMPCYYSEHHDGLRTALRQWFAVNLRHELDGMEDRDRALPSQADYQRCGEAGVFAMMIGPGPHLRLVPGGLLHGQVPEPERFDMFSELIVHEERARLGAPGAEDGLTTGVIVTLPALIHYGPEWVQRDLVPDILLGKTRIALAITEPFAGSDVASLRTRAEPAEGGGFLLNGVKKWITNSVFADWLLVLTRTRPAGGHGGLTYFLVPRTAPGVEVKPIPTDYGSCAGTGLVLLENVYVPGSHIVGGLNNGFKVCVHSFNHERWSIAAYAIGRSRYILREALVYANQRHAFGKPLSSQPVVRLRLATAAGQLESVHALIERITFQLNSKTYDEQVRDLSGPIALLKQEATRVSKVVCDAAVLVFGGRGVTKNGMGRLVDRFARAINMAHIYGGSADVMADYAMRQVYKNFPKTKL